MTYAKSRPDPFTGWLRSFFINEFGISPTGLPELSSVYGKISDNPMRELTQEDR
jgi:hypothetical protein